MSKDQLARARELAQAGRYEEATRLLQGIDHPHARYYLEKIRQRSEAARPNEQQSFVGSPQIPPPPSMPNTDNIDRSVPLVLRPPTQPHEVIVTTVDLHTPYRVVSPVYFQTSNKGLFGSSLGKLKKKYSDEIAEMKRRGSISKTHPDWGFLWYGEFSIGQNDFETAFYVSIREIQNRAWDIQAHAVVGMRQDIDLDTSGWQFFYLQMYGTAVRFI